MSTDTYTTEDLAALINVAVPGIRASVRSYGVHATTASGWVIVDVHDDGSLSTHSSGDPAAAAAIARLCGCIGLPVTKTPRPTLPEVGGGVSVHGWTDVDPGTITRVHPSGRRFWFTMDECKLLNGPTSREPDALIVTPGGFAAHWEGHQRWSMTPRPDGEEYSAFLRKNGRWTVTGSRKVVTFGKQKFYDYNF